MCRNTAFDEFKPACPGFRLNSGPPLLPVAPRKIRMEAVSVTSCGSFPLRVQAFVALGLSYFRFAAIYAAPEAELSSKLEPRIKKKPQAIPAAWLAIYFRFACRHPLFSACLISVLRQYAAPRQSFQASLDGHIKIRRISPADSLQFISASRAGTRCTRLALFPLRGNKCCASAELSSKLGRTYKNPQDFSCG